LKGFLKKSHPTIMEHLKAMKTLWKTSTRESHARPVHSLESRASEAALKFNYTSSLPENAPFQKLSDELARAFGQDRDGALYRKLIGPNYFERPFEYGDYKSTMLSHIERDFFIKPLKGEINIKKELSDPLKFFILDLANYWRYLLCT
jgi:hypothetical protein